MGGSGGGGSTTTVDPKYNAGMLELSKEQQGMAKEMFNMYKYGVTYDPNEKVYNYNGKWMTKDEIDKSGELSSVDKGLSPEVLDSWGIAYDTNYVADYNKKIENATANSISGLETKTRGELEGYDPKAQTSEMQYAQNLINSNQSLLGLQTATDKANLQLTGEQIAAQRKLLPQQTALKQSYMSDASTGLNVGDKMNQAQASVQHGFKLANQANRMDIASYGLDPSSGRYAGLTRATGMAEAAGIAGARTQAQDATEAENFRRKGLALQMT